MQFSILAGSSANRLFSLETTMTKTQIDRLGARLKKAQFEDADLRLLDGYRRSFADAYNAVVLAIRETLLLQPTGRPSKSTPSIVEKLGRESIRLSQMQDIAGCRVVVSDFSEQELVVSKLHSHFDTAVVIDRRKKPSHGYRAVHIIVTTCERNVEIQVRTALQHRWAEFSEKLADVRDPAFKYGGGEETLRRQLFDISDLVGAIESLEEQLRDMSRGQIASAPGMMVRIDPVVQEVKDQVDQTRRKLDAILIKMIDEVKKAD